MGVGRVAGDYLLQLDRRSFAYCGYRDKSYSQRRCMGFAERLAEQGFDVRVHMAERFQSELERHEEHADLVRWIGTLPGPAGIFCANDVKGSHVVEAASAAGLNVPRDVAVLGVDDEIICDFTNPPLSTVRTGADEIGFRAAELLDRLIDGVDPPGEPILIPPERLIRRRSTERLPPVAQPQADA
jgi:LacI family transcriptional regulator